jgi:hypothetical protein
MKLAENGDKWNYFVNINIAKLNSFGLPILRIVAPPQNCRPNALVVPERENYDFIERYSCSLNLIVIGLDRWNTFVFIMEYDLVYRGWKGLSSKQAPTIWSTLFSKSVSENINMKSSGKSQWTVIT